MADPISLAITAAVAAGSSALAGALSGGGGGQRRMLPRPTATPRANSVIADAVSRRRGSGANQRTGERGAESGTTAKKTLMGT